VRKAVEKTPYGKKESKFSGTENTENHRGPQRIQEIMHSPLFQK
jgi:hypothetical protein